jgi:hypothetical protein
MAGKLVNSIRQYFNVVQHGVIKASYSFYFMLTQYLTFFLPYHSNTEIEKHWPLCIASQSNECN